MIKERKEFYIKLIKESHSLLEVCKKANIVATTGNYDTLKKLIKENNIDISHFKRCNLFKGSTEKRDIEDYLSNKFTIHTYALKNKLLSNGIKEHKCECCGSTEWLGRPIPLELHHINGDNKDNRLENLQMLCPNCHTFTDNYGGKNQKLNITKQNCSAKDKVNIFLTKDKLIESIEPNCTILGLARKLNISKNTLKKYIKLYDIELPKKEKTIDINLINKLKEKRSFSQLSREFNVSETAIRLRFKRMGFPFHLKELLDYIDNNY